MKAKTLKELIKDVPDDADVYLYADSSGIGFIKRCIACGNSTHIVATIDIPQHKGDKA